MPACSSCWDSCLSWITLQFGSTSSAEPRWRVPDIPSISVKQTCESQVTLYLGYVSMADLQSDTGPSAVPLSSRMTPNRTSEIELQSLSQGTLSHGMLDKVLPPGSCTTLQLVTHGSIFREDIVGPGLMVKFYADMYSMNQAPDDSLVFPMQLQDGAYTRLTLTHGGREDAAPKIRIWYLEPKAIIISDEGYSQVSRKLNEDITVTGSWHSISSG